MSRHIAKQLQTEFGDVVADGNRFVNNLDVDRGFIDAEELRFEVQCAEFFLATVEESCYDTDERQSNELCADFTTQVGLRDQFLPCLEGVCL